MTVCAKRGCKNPAICLDRNIPLCLDCVLEAQKPNLERLQKKLKALKFNKIDNTIESELALIKSKMVRIASTLVRCLPGADPIEFCQLLPKTTPKTVVSKIYNVLTENDNFQKGIATQLKSVADEIGTLLQQIKKEKG